MKLLAVAFLALAGLFAWNFFLSGKSRPDGAKSSKSIYTYKFTTLAGKEIPFSTYQGKKILIINVASECGFTPQYEGLEKLYEANKDRLVIVGFPANDFGGQEPGTNDQIATFCSKNYGVTFPVAQKSSVVGDQKNEIFRWLTDKSLNGWNETGPKWNFTKFLLDERGELLAVYPSAVKPDDKDLLSAIGRAATTPFSPSTPDKQ